jgi:hypothetical protein
MNNRKGSKEMMSNRRIKKTMRNMMVANWIHNLPKNNTMSLKRRPQSIIKLQWCSVFGVWNCWTKLEAPPFENLQPCFPHESLKYKKQKTKLQKSLSFLKKLNKKLQLFQKEKNSRNLKTRAQFLKQILVQSQFLNMFWIKHWF